MVSDRPSGTISIVRQLRDIRYILVVSTGDRSEVEEINSCQILVLSSSSAAPRISPYRNIFWDQQVACP